MLPTAARIGSVVALLLPYRMEENMNIVKKKGQVNTSISTTKTGVVVCKPTTNAKIVTALIQTASPEFACRQCSSCHACR